MNWTVERLGSEGYVPSQSSHYDVMSLGWSFSIFSLVSTQLADAVTAADMLQVQE